MLHGTCLLNGQQPARSKEALECPIVNGRIALEENRRRGVSAPRELSDAEGAGAPESVQTPEDSCKVVFEAKGSKEAQKIADYRAH
jgi:hypothetical protein